MKAVLIERSGRGLAVNVPPPAPPVVTFQGGVFDLSNKAEGGWPTAWPVYRERA